MQWAISGRFPSVGFLCCSVDPDAWRTAVDFERNYFAGAPPFLLNAFIENEQDFPTFPYQLGCGGFAVFDAARNLKVQATLPWGQYREGAFRDVERILLSMHPNHTSGSAFPVPTAQQDKGRAGIAAIAVSSVGHQGMDSEHEKCAIALRSLQDKLSVRALRAARAELFAHFQHEEAMLRGTGFGAGPFGNSSGAFANHVKDHHRIVGIADAALAQLASACDTIEGAVPGHVAATLATAFMEHATLYDALYAGKI